jgi:5-methyltetrahydrofolate--homocysteine methyltransferase
LLNPEAKAQFDVTTRSDYERLRAEHAGKTREKKMLTIDDARSNRLAIDWNTYEPPVPEFLGVRSLTTAADGEETTDSRRVSLETLIEYIDWSPFFHAWELRGRYPAILDDAVVGQQARELFDDAQKLLHRIVDEQLITARGVFGFWPANSLGDDIEAYADESRKEAVATFHFLRQQMEKPTGQPNYCLADFVAPKESGKRDYFGGFAVTGGIGADELAKRFQADHDDYSSILTKALADRLAEAFAEYLHREARIAWGFGETEGLTKDDLIRERYRGIRPAPGYPACPDHVEKRELFDLLRVESNAGITLTESFAMHPGASVSGFYFSHPDARYFAVGKIERDQAEEYATRKGMSLAEVQKWLSPNLNFG